MMGWLFSWWPMAAAGGLYLLMGVAYLRRGEPGMAIAFFAYALANAGFILQWWRTGP